MISNVTLTLPDDTTIETNDVGIIQADGSIFFVRVWKECQFNKNDYALIDLSQIGDNLPNKICNVCHKLLPSIKFAKNQNGKDNRSVRRPTCQECRKAIDGLGLSSTEKAHWLTSKPQDGEPFECPVCGRRTIAGVTSKVVLDHNHKTGKGKAWICDTCNTGIGRYGDDPERIRRALTYLE